MPKLREMSKGVEKRRRTIQAKKLRTVRRTATVRAARHITGSNVGQIGEAKIGSELRKRVAAHIRGFRSTPEGKADLKKRLSEARRAFQKGVPGRLAKRKK